MDVCSSHSAQGVQECGSFRRVWPAVEHSVTDVRLSKIGQPAPVPGGRLPLSSPPKRRGDSMVELKLGDATVTRIEESYEPNFEAQKFFPAWNADVVRRHRDWLSPNHYDEA